MHRHDDTDLGTAVAQESGTSLSLLQRIRNGDATGWRHVVQLYSPLVYHWCGRAQLGPEDTADVFQETFRSVAQHIHSFHRDRPSDTFRGVAPGRKWFDVWLITPTERWQVIRPGAFFLEPGLVRP